MAQIINTNIASLNAQRNLNSSQSANQQALERLSSGLRINSAKDDAAGLAISTRFTSQTNGLGVAIRNAGDGISLAQTAEGALGSMTENLQRVRELAVQSSNETNSDDDRLALQQEVKQLMAEINRTAEETDFNGRKLLDGNFNGTFQIGANAGQTVDVQISELTTSKLGASDQVGVSAIGTDTGISNGDLVLNGVQIGPSTATDDNSSTVGASASGIAMAAAINRSTDETGVTAFANVNEVNGTTMTSAAGGSSGTININGVDITLQSTTNTNDVEKASTRKSVIEAINAKSDQTGVTAVDGGNENGVILVAEDGRNIVVSNTTGLAEEAYGLAVGATAAPTSGTSAGVYEAGFTLVANGDTKTIDIQGGTGTGTGDIANTGLTAGTYDRQIASYTNDSQQVVVAAGTAAQVDTEAAAALKGLEEGDLVVNGVTIGASTSVSDKSTDTVAWTSDAAASGIAIAAAINKSSDNTGVTAEVNETSLVAVSGTTGATAATAGDSISLAINNVDIGSIVSQGDLEKDRAATISAINAKSGQTGVIAEDNGEGITLTAADGRNVSVTVGQTAANSSDSFGLDDNNTGIGFVTGSAASAIASFASTAATTYSTVRLESAGEIDIEAGSNGTSGLSDSGFTRGEYGGGEDGQFLKDVDVSTFKGAQAAITAIDNALGTISSQRAELGALQNRFESTVSNLQITSENLTAANSRIRDADFAAETAELSRTQVLQQAGISILAQANQRPQQVLSLLG